MPRDSQRKHVYDACNLAHSGVWYSIPEELNLARDWLRQSAMLSGTFLIHGRRDVRIPIGRWNRLRTARSASTGAVHPHPSGQSSKAALEVRRRPLKTDHDASISFSSG